jgi:hypothetical protein
VQVFLLVLESDQDLLALVFNINQVARRVAQYKCEMYKRKKEQKTIACPKKEIPEMRQEGTVEGKEKEQE